MLQSKYLSPSNQISTLTLGENVNIIKKPLFTQVQAVSLLDTGLSKNAYYAISWPLPFVLPQIPIPLLQHHAYINLCCMLSWKQPADQSESIYDAFSYDSS